MTLLHDKCQARLHWGKAGWPQLEPCYDGSQHFPETWCQFGCAVQVTMLLRLKQHLLTCCTAVTLQLDPLLHNFQDTRRHALPVC